VGIWQDLGNAKKTVSQDKMATMQHSSRK